MGWITELVNEFREPLMEKGKDLSADADGLHVLLNTPKAVRPR